MPLEVHYLDEKTGKWIKSYEPFVPMGVVITICLLFYICFKLGYNG